MDVDRPSSTALVVCAPPPRPLNPSPAPLESSSSSSSPTSPSSSTGIDEELARAATASLSMGPATVDGPWYNFALPKKLHMGLYSNTLGDASMAAPSENDNNGKNACGSGVPGFPDFPDFWVAGEPSAKAKDGNDNVKNANQAHTTKNKQAQRKGTPPSADAAIDDELCKKVSSLFAQAKARGKDRAISNSKRRQRRIVRKAVNVPYGASSRTGTKANPCGLGAGKELKRRLRDQRRLKRIEMVVKLQEKRRRKREMGDICRSMASISCK